MTSPRDIDPVAPPAIQYNKAAPSQSRYVEVRGLRLHYLDYGSAGHTTMLCVHGAAAHAHWYDYVAPGFSSDHHVLSLDLRGHGNSAWSTTVDYSHEDFAADIDEVAKNLDLRNFVLVGHSMGGMACLTYAATYPGRLNKLIIVDARPRLADEQVAKLRDYSSQETKKYATIDDLLKRYRLQPAGTTAGPDVIRHVAGKGATQTDDGNWQHKFDRRLHISREVVDGYQYWRKIKIPALLVTGAISTRIDAQIFAEMKQCCPQIEMSPVANSDHHVTLDNPDGFVAAVRPFLAKHR